MSLKRAFLILGCSFLLLGTQAWADPTFGILTGTLTVSRLIAFGGGEQDDVRGAVQFSVSNPALLGDVILTDSQNGTDPGFAPPLLFGNTQLTGIGAGPQADTVTFDFGTQLVGPTSDSITAIGTPLFPNPNTDPALLAFDRPLLYTFTLFNFVPNFIDTTTLAQYSLTSVVATPEPALSGIVVLGLMMLLGYLRLRRTAAARQ
jgi:hypothetical protein